MKSAINETKKLHKTTNPVKICFKVNEFSSTRHKLYHITAMPVPSFAANRCCGTVLLCQTEFTSFIQALFFLPCCRSMVYEKLFKAQKTPTSSLTFWSLLFSSVHCSAICDPSREKGLMDFTKNRDFFFTVTVREFEFPRREFQIPRLIHSM